MPQIDKYDEAYFAWQKSLGQIGAKVNLFLFAPYISARDTVIDFGCGGGYLLKEMELLCAQVTGVEINPSGRDEAARMGINTVAEVFDLPDGAADVLVSNHALEHVVNPYDTLVALKNKVKLDGKAIFVVPHQTCDEKFRKGDRNQHLYTWNPMTFGNLFVAAGFEVEKVDVIRHRWIPNYSFWYHQFSEKQFRRLSTIYAYLTGNYQVRIVARNI
jgi:SAM-dependent methyltransferase